MRKTKIICTIGPASESEEILEKLCEAGMNVARLNFSHGTHDEHKAKIDRIKKVREKCKLPIPIMLDTKGPEYRIGVIKNGKVNIKEGNTFTFTSDEIEGDENKVSVSYKDLPSELNPGDTILVNNGLLNFQVVNIEGPNINCNVISGGEMSSRKSMNFPEHVLKSDFLSEQDKDDILFGIKNGIDFIAASFVSTKEDVMKIREFLDENGGSEIEIIAKIENQSGVNNIDSICEASDGIMVARGDLGVEIPFIEVPAVQKYLIKKCRLLGKRVITATEMLESMIYNPRPTRAEISDVANAVYDGTSCVMLSGESAAGKYPVEAVRSMAEIAYCTEQDIDYKKRFDSSEFEIQNISDAVSHATCAMAIDVGAKCIIASTISGLTARLVSRFRCPTDILGMTIKENVWRKLNMSWGVIPVLNDEYSSLDVMFYASLNKAKEELKLQQGDKVVLTGGQKYTTNTIRVEEVK